MIYNSSTVSSYISQVVSRVQLHFHDLQQVLGGEGLAVARMLDDQRKRSLNVVVDEAMAQQLLIRTGDTPERAHMLPEALLFLLEQQTGEQALELTVYAVVKGQYQVMLMNRRTLDTTQIRISDAILLSVISDVPFFVEANLMAHQCTEFDDAAKGVGLPINTLDVSRLNDILKKAIYDEDYELAAHVRDELKDREG